ncbi:MAG: UDP-N-acetylmuramoyl-L-alanine--D-glutamate ligase [Patescibacteria group bacterium]|jgi:UDP-N-acetylmuramoylalanine--D-glutamate ligase
MKTKIEQEKIGLLGLGIENLALLNFLQKKYKKIDITICDTRSTKEIEKNIPEIKKLKNIKWQTGKKLNENLEKYSILFRSPGWPLNCPGIKKASKNGVIISSPMNFFFQISPSKNIIGVTGTKGKGTTATLIYEIIKNSGKKCFLGGNIGIAPFNFLNKIKKNDWIVLELSSFQLEDLNYSPPIAVITNLFEEHLKPADPHNPNFHSSLNNYFQAKINIARKQNEKDFLVINKKLKNKVKLKLKGKKIYFSKSKTASKLVGDFNQENISAAEKVAEILKIKKGIVQKTIKNFSNLNHRLELVKVLEERTFYDNSFSTTPESTILDLQSFKGNIILIAGGADKGSDFKKLAQTIKNKTKFLILLPGIGTEKIKKELKKVKYPPTKVMAVDTMATAVKKAWEKSAKRDIILLSTACASFGLFKNYKERGDLFQKEVKKI